MDSLQDDLLRRLRRRGVLPGEHPNQTQRRLQKERQEAADEIERLRATLGRAAFLLGRAADACADGDLSDPRIDDLSDYAAEIEGLATHDPTQ